MVVLCVATNWLGMKMEWLTNICYHFWIVGSLLRLSIKTSRSLSIKPSSPKNIGSQVKFAAGEFQCDFYEWFNVQMQYQQWTQCACTDCIGRLISKFDVFRTRLHIPLQLVADSSNGVVNIYTASDANMVGHLEKSEMGILIRSAPLPIVWCRVGG